MQTKSESIERRISGTRRRRLDATLSPSLRRRLGRATSVTLSILAWAGLVLGLGSLAGCASQGDFLRLQEQVSSYHKGKRGGPDPFARIAQLSAEVDSMRQEMRDLQGELELARKESADALEEVRRTRASLAEQSSTAAVAVNAAPTSLPADEAAALPALTPPSPPSPPTSAGQELSGYQEALDAWRKKEYGVCIDRFTTFLQGFPTSGYADDAAYWLADCTYKNEEYKRAVVRFSDVVRVYPDSPKAPDALYRQGESLLKLGPRFVEAARTVFKRLQNDYPESDRAPEAKRQLERLGPGAAAAR